MNDRRRYARINSLKELQEEQAALKLTIRAKEEILREHLDELRDAIDPGHLAKIAVNAVAPVNLFDDEGHINSVKGMVRSFDVKPLITIASALGYQVGRRLLVRLLARKIEKV